MSQTSGCDSTRRSQAARVESVKECSLRVICTFQLRVINNYLADVRGRKERGSPRRVPRNCICWNRAAVAANRQLRGCCFLQKLAVELPLLLPMARVTVTGLGPTCAFTFLPWMVML